LIKAGSKPALSEIRHALQNMSNSGFLKGKKPDDYKYWYQARLVCLHFPDWSAKLLSTNLFDEAGCGNSCRIFPV